jgi:hypothetical protein
MSVRWEHYLNRAEEEAPKIKSQAQGAPPATEQIKNAAGQHLPPEETNQAGAHRY